MHDATLQPEEFSREILPIEGPPLPPGFERAAHAGSEIDLFGKPPPEGKQDWSHRRAEPRPLALAWTCFLLIATTLSFVRASGGEAITAADYRPHARELLFLITLGLIVLWPMLRLSQRRPEPGTRVGIAVMRDLAVLLLTTQAMIWPHVYLARYPLDVLGGVAVLCTGWALIAGAMLWVAQAGAMRRGDASHGSRGWWMVCWLVVVLGGGAWALAEASLIGGLSSGEGAQPGWLRSPLTGVLEMLRDRPSSGFAAAITAEHWTILIRTLLIGGLCWVVAAVWGLMSPPGEPDSDSP